MNAPCAAATCASPIAGSNRLTARSGLFSTAIRIASSRVSFNTVGPGWLDGWPGAAGVCAVAAA
jgi:hypothetical protein